MIKKTTRPGTNNATLVKSWQYLVITSIFTILPLFAAAEVTATQSAAQLRLARQIATVEKQQERYNLRIQQADSLMAVGDSMMVRTAEIISQTTERMRQRANAYTAQRRELERNLANADREEFNQLRLDIRNLDTQYRAELSADEEIMRIAIREGEIGASNYDRGKESRRETEKLLREVNRQLASLNEENSQQDIAQQGN